MAPADGALAARAAEASEHYVGLPDGQMGNSEVGHTNLGAGRLVLQDLARIDAAVASGELARMAALRDFIARLNKSGGTAHLLGLLSPGGVHSHQRQIAALARILAEAGVPVAVHAILDGRDTPPEAALSYLKTFESDVGTVPRQLIATVGGRYYAMDRDQRWDRVEKAYRTIVEGGGDTAASARDAVEAAYGRGETDEFVRPTAIGGYRGMRDGDGVADRQFPRRPGARNRRGLARSGFFRVRARRVASPLPRRSAWSNIRPSSTPFWRRFSRRRTSTTPLARSWRKPGCASCASPRPRNTRMSRSSSTAAARPSFPAKSGSWCRRPRSRPTTSSLEMSAPEVTDKVVEAIAAGRFDVIVLNYANADMVGHTGMLDAAVEAVETIDRCLGRLATAVGHAGGTLVVTADHGNAEMMRDPQTGEPHTAHTLNPVPFLVVNPPGEIANLADGRLADVAPTLLDLLGLDQPAAMTGHSLIVPQQGQRRAG